MSFQPLQEIRTLLRPWWHRQRCFRVMDRIAEWLSRQADWVGPVLYDVGARWGASPPYDRLSRVPGFRSVGFEPDIAEAERLRAGKAFTFVCPVALGARSEKRTLHIAKDAGSSSLYRPNPAEIARHTTWRGYETVREINVSVEDLDRTIPKYELPPPDYMKLDCEGAEGEVLSGTSATISSLWGITFEARLFNLYLEETETLSKLLDRMVRAGFICLRVEPVGAFFGSDVMFDVVMMKHPENIRDRRHLVLSLVFCLLHGNWHYAQRVVDYKGTGVGCGELRRFLRLP